MINNRRCKSLYIGNVVQGARFCLEATHVHPTIGKISPHVLRIIHVVITALKLFSAYTIPIRDPCSGILEIFREYQT